MLFDVLTLWEVKTISNSSHIQLQVNLEHLANWEEKQMFKEYVDNILDLLLISL